MTSTPKIHVADIGTLLRFDIVKPDGTPLDVSAAATKVISFQRPSGVTFERAASFQTDGTNGVLLYTTVVGDIDVDGYWHLQGHVTFGGGTPDLHSDRVRVRIWPNNAAPAP